MPDKEAVDAAQRTQARIVQDHYDNARTLINNSFDSLVTNDERKKIPEQVFRQSFLPFFTGKEVAPERNPVVEWIAIAGTPTSRVDVVNDDKEVLFTVPPLFDTSSINVDRAKGQTLSNIVSEYERQRDYLPAVGQRFAQNALAEKVDQLTDIPAGREGISREWGAVFQYYNLSGAQDGNKQTTKVEDDGSDDLVFD